jgi:hypothetical protein
MKCATINIHTNIVTNIVIADSSWNPGGDLYCVVLGEDESCNIGQMYDPKETPRFVGTPVATPRTYTAYQFLLLFTPEERAAFRAAAMTDPIIADYQVLAGAAQEIHTDDPMTIAGLDYLVSAGVLTEQRKKQVLS